MKILGLHHVAVAVADMADAEAFYVGILGLRPCPEKPNWLAAGHGYEVHLMPLRAEPVPPDPVRHFTLEVERLEDAASHLLACGLRPYQVTVDQLQRREITAPDDPLDFGIGTLFVEDPDGNSVELLQRNRGITAEVLGTRGP